MYTNSALLYIQYFCCTFTGIQPNMYIGSALLYIYCAFDVFW
jgi:hypothetical protein